MSISPEHDPLNPTDPGLRAEELPPVTETGTGWDMNPAELGFPAEGAETSSLEFLSDAPGNSPEILPVDFTDEQPTPQLFQAWSQPEPVVPHPARIPHLGHLALLGVFTCVGLLGTTALTQSALHYHLFGVLTIKQAAIEIHYTLGSMAALYLLTFLASTLVFPLIWHKGLLAGLQWQGETAIRLRRQLGGAAFLCFVLALLNGWLLPGPTNAPIDKLFRTASAAWLMLGFGITIAPFFEEIVFRGFLLPALCTAFDWVNEKMHHEPAPALDANGHPQWSMPAMILGSFLTSVPFALMHAEQTGYSVGPFTLLVCVSLILCWVRLATRSLAASMVVHACYNFLLFSIMLLGTGGFRHLEKM